MEQKPNPNRAVEKAVSLLGRQELLAEAVGTKQTFVSAWARGARPVPNEFCTAIECVTKGAVTCEELRPGVRWGRIPDPDWPWHPQGRPVVEVKHDVCAADAMPTPHEVGNS
jgi:DNA-binding transcriptional regulator YdaS (Cro superfamily)